MGETISAPSEEYLEKVQAAWRKYAETGVLDRDSVRPAIANSWERCARLGLDPCSRSIQTTVEDEGVRRRIIENEAFLETARPFMANLYNSLKEVDLMIALLDRDGLILEIMGDGLITDLCAWGGLVQGQFWTEETIGTTAPSITLVTGDPQQVVAEEHWLEICKGCTCAAAPIKGPDGVLVGVLNITALYEEAGAHLHTYGMAIAASRAIETALKVRSISVQLDTANKFLHSAIRSISDGLILLDHDLEVIDANPLARKIIGPSLVPGANLQNAFKDRRDYKRIRKVLMGREGFYGQELIFVNPSGDDQRFIVDAEPVMDKDRECIGVLLVLREMGRARKLAHRMYGAHAIYTFDDLIGNEVEFRLCLKNAKLAASADCPIVLTGESGTGKEMFAQAIHNFSDRASGPFIPINCAAIPRDLLESELLGYEEGAFTGAKKGGNPGKFELADQGTIFLDEIDSMPLELQAKLLRVLEEKRVLRLGGMSFIPVDVRVVAASCKDLQQKVREDSFRGDLFFRINVVNIDLPPLRERRGDIPLLASHFVAKYSKSPDDAKRYLQPEILETLQAYDWPGNVRELSNWAERILAVGGMQYEPRRAAVPSPIVIDGEEATTAGLENNGRKLGEAEALCISEAIKSNRYNMSKAAADLGISRSTLYRKMAKYDIDGHRHAG
jgi:transcriptional regulator of acetoin/glycerol metabolism